MQFPDPWLSEILKPLSDAIFVNSSVKLVLMLTLLARKCICWRSWMIRSNGPSREIIWGGFHWIIQCSSNKRFHLRKNTSNFRPNFEFNMISFCFFSPLGSLSASVLQAKWNFNMMWLGNEFSVSEAITTQIKVAKEINPVEISDFVSMWRASLKWTRSFPISRVMHGKIMNEDINWSKTLPTGIRLFFQLEGKTLNLKNTTRSSQSGSSDDRSITLFTKQILPSDSIIRKVTK